MFEAPPSGIEAETWIKLGGLGHVIVCLSIMQRAEGREDTSYRDPPCPGSWDWSQSCTVTEPHRRGRSEPPRAGLSLQTAKETARDSERPGAGCGDWKA